MTAGRNLVPVIALVGGLLAALSAAGQTVPGLAPRNEEARQYAACMRLAHATPKAAYDSALAWRKKGGGDAALHCVAVALLELGQPDQAARLMEGLAARIDDKRAALKAALLGQAASAWTIAGQSPLAEKRLTEALALRPHDVELHIDRSIARAAQGKFWDALDDLNAALDRAPHRVDVLTLRASAWQHVGSSELARQDIDQALALRPDDPDALLERGLIRKSTGDIDGARADWLRVLQVAGDGPLAEDARRNIESIDVRTKR